MSSKFWIKLYHEILDDHKMGMLSDHLYRRVIELFLVAGEYDKEGLLPSLDAMAWRLRVSPDELTKDIQALHEKNILSFNDGSWIVTKFAERQAPASSAERMKRMRDRKQKDSYYTVTNTVTKRNADIDIDIESDKMRKDKRAIAKETKTKAVLAFEQVMLNIKAYKGVSLANQERLARCTITDNEGDVLILQPDTEENHDYLIAHMLTKLNRQVAGINGYNRVVIKEVQ